MPARWCDAHHILPWEAGGPTSLENLVLVCRHHHRLVHDFGWSVHLDRRARPRFRRPDGHELDPDPGPLDVARRGAHIADRARRRRLDDDLQRARRSRRPPQPRQRDDLAG
ncbi:MAG: HNH endonuclease signature motif containing protein [Acidimicrobiia bacterium]|nr:HNH endonuclease signature motif containing protein [Acidimicrobiia bacterium]